MNLILRSVKEVIKPNTIQKVLNKSFYPCEKNCICLLYLDLNNVKSQKYYKNCYITKTKLIHFRYVNIFIYFISY